MLKHLHHDKIQIIMYEELRQRNENAWNEEKKYRPEQEGKTQRQPTTEPINNVRNKKEKRMQKTNAKSGRARLQIMKHPASLTSFQQWIYDAR